MQGDEQGAIQQLKTKLMDIIVSQRLVQQKQLDYLFRETGKANNVKEEVYENMVGEIKEDIGYCEDI